MDNVFVFAVVVAFVVAVVTAVAEYAASVINSSEFLASRLHMDRVNEVLGEHRSGKTNRGAEVWSLMNLALWHRVWIEGRDS